MTGLAIITLIVILVIEILFFRLIYKTEVERFQNRRKLLLVLLVTVAIGVVLAIQTSSSSSPQSESQRQEYGFFNRKKTVVVKTERTNYGNPMKKQDYIPRNAVRVTPKTDSSKIYVRA